MLQEDEMVGHYVHDELVVFMINGGKSREAALLRLHTKRKRRWAKKAQCLELVEDNIGGNTC